MKKYNMIFLPSTIVWLMFLTNCSNIDQQSKSTGPIMEPHRPHFHFTPDSAWMNDPNGMVYYDGEYHLFYQCYPDSNVWGPMHWGHAISRDLVHWQRLPVALFPDENGWIFSGSAVVDYENRSGLGTAENPPMVAIFTYHNHKMDKAGRIDYQTQGIAYSTDKGRTWEKYEGNPVLHNPGIRDFRDPKVFWYEPAERWIMALAVKDHISFYSSENLIDWNHESDFGEGFGAHGGVWECPDLFPLDVNGKEKWVLLVSINPGGINGGSATQYFIGDFNGIRFTSDNSPETVLWADWGKDDYAGVTWAGIPESDGRRIFMGWMSNWQYGQVVPTSKWRSAMTIPRSLQLRQTAEGLRLISQPVQELTKLRNDTVAINQSSISNVTKTIYSNLDKALTGELDLTLLMKNKAKTDTSMNFVIEISNENGENVKIGYAPAKHQFFTDRSHSGETAFNIDFPVEAFAKRISISDTIQMKIFIDVASVEFFADDGEVVMTNIFFPTENYTRIGIFSAQGDVSIIDGKFYPLANIWE